MTKTELSLVQANPWERLRRHTSARIALGRVGSSLPTDEVLRFGLAHARARDAVHRPMDSADLLHRLADAGFSATSIVRSLATSRQEYLLRPDLGRQLDPACTQPLVDAMREARVSKKGSGAVDDVDSIDDVDVVSGERARIAVVVADGLSSVAIERHAVPLLEAFRTRFKTDWPAVAVVVAEQARVAIGDDIGEALGASMVIVLIGERPGLSSPDSLGIYFTWQPHRGRADSERNCISNVRPEGLGYDAAAAKLAHMVAQAMRLELTGVALKDDSDTAALEAAPVRSLAPGT